jgi:LTXXQ motif family protein
MFKAPMLLAAVLVVCVASSADARRRHHGYYGYYGERDQSNLDDWRRARDAQGQGQGGGQAQSQDQGQNQVQDQRQGQAQDQRQDQNQDRAQDRVQDRRDYRARERGDRRRARSLDEWRRSRETQNQGQAQGQDSGQNHGQDSRQDLARDRGEDRSRDTYDRRRGRYDEWRRTRDERRARYDDWRRNREREDWTRWREAERGDAVMRPGRGGPFAAVVEKLVRGCGAQGAEFENWPFDTIAEIVGADEKERTALEGLRASAKKAAERLAADCPQDVPAAPAARLEAVEQGIDAALKAFDTVEPALTTFYGTLDDEQKARLYRDMAAPAASNARETTPRREAQEERRERRGYSSRRDRWRAYAAAREAAAREPTPSQARSQAAAPGWSGAMCEELATVLRGWPVREIERDVRLSSPQRVAFYELVTASLKAADTLAGACPAETALTPVGRMDAMRKRLAAVRAATAAIRPALMHFYEALDQGQKVRFAGMS